MAITRLGLYGGARQLYGSFNGKEVAVPRELVSSEGFRQNVGKMMK